MKIILGVIHAFLYTCTLALSANYFGHLNYQVPDVVYYGVVVAVFGVSLLIALGNMIGGGLMGLTAGGVWDGMRLGLILGIGTAIGRLWPYMLIIAAVAFIYKVAAWVWILSLLGGAICYGVHYLMRMIWSHVT